MTDPESRAYEARFEGYYDDSFDPPICPWCGSDLVPWLNRMICEPCEFSALDDEEMDAA